MKMEEDGQQRDASARSCQWAAVRGGIGVTGDGSVTLLPGFIVSATPRSHSLVMLKHQAWTPHLRANYFHLQQHDD